MSQFDKYKQKPPAVFTRMVGVNYGTFTIILEKLQITLGKYQSEKPKRRSGKRCSMSLADQLLLTLLYLRTYDTLLNIGFQFGVSESYAQKRYTFTKMLLLRCLDLPDEQALKEAISGDKVAIDVTEQAIERPLNNQQDYYSGKKKLHTIKILLIVCLLTGLIQAIRFDKGKNHDFQIYKNSNFNLSDELEMSVDSGFQGIQKLHSKVQMPEKSSKLHPLNKAQKEENTKKASKRVPVEHINRKCKIFKICGCRFRGKHRNYEDTWKLISSIVNLKISTRHLKFSSY